MNWRIRSRLFFDATYGEFSSLFHPRICIGGGTEREKREREGGGFCKGRALKAAKMPHPSPFERNFCKVIIRPRKVL